MFDSLTNLSKLFKTASQIMPRVQRVKSELAVTHVEATCRNDQIQIRITGTGSITELSIPGEMLSPDNKADVEQAIVEATNAAIVKAKALHLKAIREITSDLGIPGVDKILEELAE